MWHIMSSPIVPPWRNDLYQSGAHTRRMARIGPKKPLRLYLAEWRDDRGLTQKQLGDRVGATSQTVSRWETGERRPDLDAQAAISEALGIQPVDLYRHPDQPSADALLRDQPSEIRDQAIKLIKAIRRA